MAMAWQSPPPFPKTQEARLHSLPVDTQGAAQETSHFCFPIFQSPSFFEQATSPAPRTVFKVQPGPSRARARYTGARRTHLLCGEQHVLIGPPFQLVEDAALREHIEDVAGLAADRSLNTTMLARVLYACSHNPLPLSAKNVLER
jgi:hypothetical protein